MNHLKQTIAAFLLLATVLFGVSLVWVQASGAKLFSVQSGSMVPRLHKGDLVIVKRVPVSTLATGDIITFINPKNTKQTITHRIVSLPSAQTEQKIITKGDANLVADTPIAANSVLGKRLLSMPLVGFLIDFIRKPLGLLLLVYVPALFVILAEVRRLAKYYKDQQPYMAPGYEPHISSDMPGTITAIVKIVGIGLVGITLFAWPVKAALSSQVTLANNTISTSVINANHLVFKQLTLRCSEDNSRLANNRPEIILFNPTTDKIDLSGWSIKDNGGTIVTFTADTKLTSNHRLVVTPWLLSGLQYAGDRLVLVNTLNVPVDGLGWGTDSSQFNPAIAGVKAGSRLRRTNETLDTNSALDWLVTQHHCETDQDNHDQSGDHYKEREDESDDSNASHENDRTTVEGHYKSEERKDD